MPCKWAHNASVKQHHYLITIDAGAAGNGPLPKTNGSLNTSPIASKPFKGPIDCLMTMYKTHGIKAWYKGLVPMFWR